MIILMANDYPIASYSEDQRGYIEDMWPRLKIAAEKQFKLGNNRMMYFHLQEIPHNPTVTTACEKAHFITQEISKILLQDLAALAK